MVAKTNTWNCLYNSNYLFCIAILIVIFFLVKDSVLLSGSIKQNKGALGAGAIMEGMTLLGLLGIGIYFIKMFYESYSKGSMANPIVTLIPWIFFVFKLWNFLIIIGAMQEVVLINCRCNSKCLFCNKTAILS